MEKIRFAVTGEGPTDYGKKIYDTYMGEYRWEEGPVFPILRRTAEKAGQKIHFEAIDKKDIYRLRTQRSMSKIRGLTGKANDSARFSLYLAMHKYSYGVFYCDADKETGKKNTDRQVCRKRFCQVREEVLDGYQKSGLQDLKIIPMIPMKMIECWLMSDETAYEALFGLKDPDLPFDPELIWGDEKDPDGNYPKNRMKRILKQGRGAEIPMNMETYRQIAEKTDIEVLLRKCPISFRTFYEDFEKAFQNPACKTGRNRI